MNWNTVHWLYTWPTLLVILFLLVMSVYSWRRRNVPGAFQFAIGCLITALWLYGSFMEYMAADLAARIFWVKFQGACYIPALTAVTAFLLEYASPGRWLTRRAITLLTIPPLIFLALALTNDLHHYLWLGFTTAGKMSVAQSGPAFWPFLAYAFALGLLQLVIYLYLLRHWPYNRWPIALMLVGHITTRTLWLTDRFGNLHTSLPLDTVLIAYMFAMFAIALFVFRIFNPLALARQTVIAQMHSGLLVLELQGRVVSMNPAAQAILGVSPKYAKRRPVQDLFPAAVDLSAILAAQNEQEQEIRLPAGASRRDYQLKMTPLKDWRGLKVGSLLGLSDVTDQKLAQQKSIEQQRTLAMLREREQLARELHDSTAQVLSFASLRIATARKLISDGKPVSADDQLDRLETVLAEAHADVREHILNLRFAPSGEKPFYTALQQYLDSFRQNYAIQALLYIGDDVEAGALAPDAQLQVFRIIQEALSNARKHGGADCVQLSFEQIGDRLRVRIEDNGRGFDPSASGAKNGHFGIQFMRERAEQLGGVLCVCSAPGEGTRVEVETPLEKTRQIR